MHAKEIQFPISKMQTRITNVHQRSAALTNFHQLSPTFTKVANGHDVQTPLLEIGFFSTEPLSKCKSVGRRPKEQNCRSSAPPSKTLPETERPLFAKIRHNKQGSNFAAPAKPSKIRFVSSILSFIKMSPSTIRKITRHVGICTAYC